MQHIYTALLSLVILVTSCEKQDSRLPEHKGGDFVKIRLSQEQVMVLRHAYHAFTYDDGVYEVRHKDGRITEVQPFEIEK